MTFFVLIVSLLLGIVLAEITLRSFGGTWFRNQLIKTGGLLQTFRAANGDDERQAVLLRSGRDTLQFGFVMLVLLTLLLLIAYFPPWWLVWSESQKIVYFVVISMVATVWMMLRRQQRSALLKTTTSSSSGQRGGDYSILDQWLHWLALKPAVVGYLAFDLERHFALPKRATSTESAPDKVASPADGAVYVCGLARSGTTMLLHILDEIEIFRSLTYRDMPFVLAPNLWKQITRYSPRLAVPVERAHGDNIFVHFDSAEGFEEVFWRTFGRTMTDSHCLGVEEPSFELLADFADYRALVANPRNEALPANGVPYRYLSKNNNNLLRLRSLCADQTATVLLVYRNPVATARSLYRQHQRFCAAQTEDHFTRTYMGWLVHHEFGLDHLPFCFAVPEMDVSLTPEDPNYWLDYWNSLYSYILAKSDFRLHLVNHDVLCTEPEEMLTALFDILGIKANTEVLARMINTQSADVISEIDFHPELLLRTETTYRALLNSPRNINGY